MTNETLKQALEADGCERIKDFYNVGPVQRAAVESFAAAIEAEQAKGQVAKIAITEAQAKAIMDMALDLEKTGRVVSLSEGQERSDYVARNRNIQCALGDYLRNLTTSPAQPAREWKDDLGFELREEKGVWLVVEDGAEDRDATLTERVLWDALEAKNAGRVAELEREKEAMWINPNLEYMAEEADCVALCLNKRGVPTSDGDKALSLWGRVEQYAKPRFLEGMATKDPEISEEHVKALAKVAGLLGNYTTAEFVQCVVGFAHVLLGNKAVQESFVKANTQLLYTTPPAQPAREWMGLTDEEILDTNYPDGTENGPTVAAREDALDAFARQIEAKLREKNAGQPVKEN